MSLSQRLLDFWLQVDSANKYGVLLEVVQVLTDLKLIVKKAYISSDGGWFMDGRTKLKLVPFYSFSSKWCNNF